MPKLILNILGHPGSGKSTACEYLRTKYGFELYRPSDALRRYAAEHDIELHSRTDYIFCHEQLIQNDPDAIIRPVQHSNAELICVDGLLAPAPYKRLKAQYADRIRMLYLSAPIERRFANTTADSARTGHRLRPSLEDFQADELPNYHNANPELPSVDEMITMADFIVDAGVSKDHMLAEVDKIVASLL